MKDIFHFCQPWDFILHNILRNYYLLFVGLNHHQFLFFFVPLNSALSILIVFK